MQFMVPQDVQRADRILGPLTVRGFLTALGGGAMAYIAYLALNSNTWPIVSGLIILLTVAFIFVRVHDMPFGQFLFSLVLYVFRPQRRLRVQHSGDLSLPIDFQPVAEKKEKQEEPEDRVTAARIGNLAQTLEAAATSEQQKFSQAKSLEMASASKFSPLDKITSHGRKEAK